MFEQRPLWLLFDKYDLCKYCVYNIYTVDLYFYFRWTCNCVSANIAYTVHVSAVCIKCDSIQHQHQHQHTTQKKLCWLLNGRIEYVNVGHFVCLNFISIDLILHIHFIWLNMKSLEQNHPHFVPTK